MKKKVFFIVALALALTGCRQQAGDETVAADFETMTVGRRDITLEQSYPASIEGRQSVKIVPRIEGYLQKVCVREGQHVRKGQVLFIIDQTTSRASRSQPTASTSFKEK